MFTADDTNMIKETPNEDNSSPLMKKKTNDMASTIQVSDFRTVERDV